MSDTPLAPATPDAFPAGAYGNPPLPRVLPEPDALGSPVIVDNSQDQTNGG